MEDCDDFLGCELLGRQCEADEIGEEDRDVLEVARRDFAARRQFGRHRLRQDVEQQFVRRFALALDLVGSAHSSRVGGVRRSVRDDAQALAPSR